MRTRDVIKALLASAVLALGAWRAEATTLRIGAQQLPNLRGNPYSYIALPSALMAQMIFDPLIHVGPGGEAKPALAIQWQQESPTVWVFTLRPNVTFADGSPFNANAVIAAFDYLRTDIGRRDSVASQDIAVTVQSVVARGELSVAVTTQKPDPVLPLHLSFVRIPSAMAWSTLGRDNFARAPVGTGPFVVTEWNENRVRLKAHRAAWRAPKIDNLDVSEIPDPTARVQALISGAIDVALAVSPEDKSAIENSGGRIAIQPMPLMHFLAFVTTKDTPLKDARVRRALNHAIDTKAIIAAFLDNATKPAAQFSHGGAFGFDASLEAYNYDPERARALLREAGYGNGFSFTAALDPTSGGGYVDWYQRIAQDLAKVGVTMGLRLTPSVQMIQNVQTGNWPTDSFAWSFAGFDSLRGYRFRSCAWTHPYHCDQGLMSLIAAAENAPSEAERTQRTREVLAAERDNPPGVMLWRGVAFDGLGERVDTFETEDDLIRWDKATLKK